MVMSEYGEYPQRTTIRKYDKILQEMYCLFLTFSQCQNITVAMRE